MSTSHVNDMVTEPRLDAWAPTSSPKWLSFGPDGEQRLMLRGETNLSMVEVQIKTAMRSGEPLVIELQGDDPTTQSRIILNCDVLPFVVLIESV
jgi:hypothetical protein